MNVIIRQQEEIVGVLSGGMENIIQALQAFSPEKTINELRSTYRTVKILPNGEKILFDRKRNLYVERTGI